MPLRAARIGSGRSVGLMNKMERGHPEFDARCGGMLLPACASESTRRARRQHSPRELRKQVLDAGCWRQRRAGVFAGWRQFERGGAVEAAFDESLAEKLVAAGVGSALELGEHREVGLDAAHFGGRALAVFQQHQPAHERRAGVDLVDGVEQRRRGLGDCARWRRPVTVGTEVVGDPEISSGADDFLAAVVEVVAERADLRLELEHPEQALLVDDHGIPVLGRAEEPRQGDLGFLAMDSVGG